MAGDYNLGTARGHVEITADTSAVDATTKSLSGLERQSLSSDDALRKLSTGALVAGGVIAGGLVLAVNTAADFEQRLSAIQAVSGDTAEGMDRIREKALQIGKDTAFSASEAALAFEELVKAGISSEDAINGAADATVALAAAGEIDLPLAATIASNAMNNFQLAAEDLPRVADLLVGAANASAIGIEDLGESMKYVGPVANALGMDIADVSTALALLGNQGIRGSAAGTMLRSMLGDLVPQTDKAEAAMRKLGLITEEGANQFFDATGNVKPFNEIVGILRETFGDMDAQQLSTYGNVIFGQRAFAGLAAMAGTSDKALADLNRTILETRAADVAAVRMGNFQGSLEELSGSLETIAIDIGTKLLPVLTVLVDWLGGVVDAIGALPDWVVTAGTTFAVLASGGLLAYGMFVKLRLSVLQYAAAMAVADKTSMLSISGLKALAVQLALGVKLWAQNTAQVLMSMRNAVNAGFAFGGLRGAMMGLGATIGGVTAALAPLTIALAAVTAGIILWNNYNQHAEEGAASLANGIDVLTGKLNEYGRATIAKRLLGEVDPEHWAFLDTLGVGLDEAMAAIEGGEAALTSYYDKVNEATGALQEHGITAGVVTNAIDYEAKAFNRQTDEMLKNAIAADVAAGGSGNAADGMKKLAGEADGAADSIKEVEKALRFFDLALRQQDAMDQHRANLMGIEAQVEKYGVTLDASTKKGLENRDAYRSMFSDAAAAAEAWGERAGATQAQVAAASIKRMAEIREGMIAKGFKPKDVEAFMGSLDALPEQINYNVVQPTAQEMARFYEIGANATRGMAEGIRSQLTNAANASSEMSLAVVLAARRALKTESPSRVFIEIGGNVADGFEIGLSKLTKVSSGIKDKIQPALDAAEDRINKWVRAQKDALDEAMRAWQDYRNQVFSAITGNVNVATAWTDTEDQIAAVADAQRDLTEAQNAYAKARARGKEGDDYTSEIDDVAVAQAALAAAQSAVRTFEQNLEAQVDTSILYGDMFKAASEAMIAQFGADSLIWQRMREQILTMTPEQATALATTLAGGFSEQTVNKLRGFDMYAGGVSDNLAEQSQGQGVKQAASMLKGINKKVAEEEAKIQAIGVKIGAGIVLGFASQRSAFRSEVDRYIASAYSALGINSPSKVFIGIGESVGEGFNLGVERSMPDVEDAFLSLMRANFANSSAFDAGMSATLGATYSGVVDPPLIPVPNFVAKVYVGNQEITDIVKVEIEGADRDTLSSMLGGI